jgi:hypothetical protein
MDISELHFQTNASISDVSRREQVEKTQQLHSAETTKTCRARRVT